MNTFVLKVKKKNLFRKKEINLFTSTFIPLTTILNNIMIDNRKTDKGKILILRYKTFSSNT